MKSIDKVPQHIIADSEETRLQHNRLNRRQFFGRIGTIGGAALSSIPAFAQIGGRVLTPTTQKENLTPVVEVVGKKVWEEDKLNEDAVGDMIDEAILKLTGRENTKEAWRDFVLPGPQSRYQNQSTRWTKIKHTFHYCQ